MFELGLLEQIFKIYSIKWPSQEVSFVFEF